ncbi:MAG TPA: hypothetical protein VG034_22190 [Acidimicrobiia bacterium]|jgi:hypothetical protein|nr:hypothetical protein [Acidimicrobiia bacterium]
MSSRSRRRRATQPPRRAAIATSSVDEVAAPTVSPIDPALAARRVAVRNPRGRATRRAPGERALTELAEQTEVGEILLRSLTRAQLMLAVRIFAVFGCLLLGLPALFATHPGLADFRVLGLPLPWVLLGGAVYPLLVFLGVLYVRHAERNERDFVEFIERS